MDLVTKMIIIRGGSVIEHHAKSSFNFHPFFHFDQYEFTW